MADTIAVSDVTKEYGTAVKTKALRGVSFRVEGGEFLSIIGQSGSGKSTLLNLLGLLDRPTGGTVSLLGTDVGALSKKERAEFRNGIWDSSSSSIICCLSSRCARTCSSQRWISGSRDGDKATDRRRARAGEILDFLGVGQVAGKGADQISGGQKQRVAIGRALMNSPDIILADEPTGNLDTENSALVYDLFRRIHREMGTTFVVVTHDRAIAQQTDRIIEVVDGLISQDVRNDYLAGN